MRVCPACNNKIQNPKTNFCFKCGARLFKDSDTKDLLQEPASKATLNSTTTIQSEKQEVLYKQDEVVNSKKEPDTLSKKWNYFVISSNFVAILFLLASVGVFFRYNLKPFKQLSSPLVSINNVEVVEKVNISTDNEVLKTNFSSIIPANVLVYYESNDSGLFLSKLLDDSQKEYLEKTYELKFEDLLIFLKPDFTYAKLTNDTWVVIARAGGTDFFDRTYSLYLDEREDSEPVSTERIGDFLVFTNDSITFDKLNSVLAEVELPLSKNPEFNTAINRIEGEPFFFLYTTSQDYIEKNLENDLVYFDLASIYSDLEGTTFNAVALTRIEGEIKIQNIN